MPIAYAQLLSMNNIQMLSQLAQAQAKMNQAQKNAPVPDIKPMLGDDDMISFQ